jgi:hypothetical protein
MANWLLIVIGLVVIIAFVAAMTGGRRPDDR